MKNWATSMYTEAMEKKTIPLFIEEIKGYTGFYGDFPIEYRPKHLILGGPRVEVDNIHRTEKTFK